MNSNTHLKKAEAKKDNEFYTRFEDIEKELEWLNAFNYKYLQKSK